MLTRPAGLPEHDEAREENWMPSFRGPFETLTLSSWNWIPRVQLFTDQSDFGGFHEI